MTEDSERAAQTPTLSLVNQTRESKERNIMSVTLSEQDKTTLRVAAYGAVTLLSAAGAAGGSPHKIAANGSIALGSATGLVGHVLADYPKTKELNGKSVAVIADRVLPALTAAMSLLK